MQDSETVTPPEPHAITRADLERDKLKATTALIWEVVFPDPDERAAAQALIELNVAYGRGGFERGVPVGVNFATKYRGRVSGRVARGRRFGNAGTFDVEGLRPGADYVFAHARDVEARESAAQAVRAEAQAQHDEVEAAFLAAGIDVRSFTGRVTLGKIRGRSEVTVDLGPEALAAYADALALAGVGGVTVQTTVTPAQAPAVAAVLADLLNVDAPTAAQDARA